MERIVTVVGKLWRRSAGKREEGASRGGEAYDDEVENVTKEKKKKNNKTNLSLHPDNTWLWPVSQ